MTMESKFLVIDSATQIVNVIPETEIKLIQFVAESISKAGGDDDRVIEEANQYLQECARLIEEANAPELIRALISKRDVVFSRDSETDIEACFQLISYLLYKTENTSEIPPLIREIVDAVLEDQSSKVKLRLIITTNLYNMLPSGTHDQFKVLISMIEYAARTGQLFLLDDFFFDAESWTKGLELRLEEQREMYLLISECFADVGRMEESQKFLLRYLVTFESGSQKDIEGIRNVAARCAVGALKTPIISFTKDHNLLELSPIAALKHDEEYGDLYELLSIFSKDKVDSYRTFIERNPSVLQNYGLDDEECVSSMRLLSLCSLAIEHEEIPYRSIMETLGIDRSEVEIWVMKAINASLLKAKMDQLQEVVVVSWCTRRDFFEDHWRELEEKLGSWKKNIQSLLFSFRKSKEGVV